MGYRVGYGAQHPIYDFTLNRPFISNLHDYYSESEQGFMTGS